MAVDVGLKYNLYDWTHHGAYIGGVVGTWVLIEQIAAKAV